MMPSLGCLWSRPRLERLVDGALGPRAGRLATSHAARCARYGGEVEQLTRMRLLVRSAAPDVGRSRVGRVSRPAVRVRIASEAPRPVRESWWLPYWKPVWGHPRVALGSLMVSSLALGLMLWPSAPGTLAAPVTVQEVSSADPDRSVMVYSSPDDDVTVIWVFNPAEQDEQS